MSSETFTYKGISAGKYVEGEIEAISQEEANYKLKEQKIIITNMIYATRQSRYIAETCISQFSKQQTGPLAERTKLN